MKDKLLKAIPMYDYYKWLIKEMQEKKEITNINLIICSGRNTCWNHIEQLKKQYSKMLKKEKHNEK